ncbi:hypothetical protein LUZ60_010793 [Juncus effusus]|nr:hypothetical protein LUZ60_010793 [Juncus effusus]
MNVILLFSLTLLLMGLFHIPLALAADTLYQICGSTNYTANSTYESNLNILFSSLYTETAVGFSETSIGAVPNKIDGLFLCRGDVNSSACGSCLNQSFEDVSSLCPYAREAVIYYDFCLLRYSNQNFLNSTNQSSSEVYMWNTQNITVPRFSGWDPSNNTAKSYLNTLVNTLLSGISDWAAFNSTRRFGTGDIKITDSLPMIYGLTQCIPDLSSNDCRGCLQALIDQMLKWFDGRQGGRIIGYLCTLRYEIFPFFNGDPILLIGSTGSSTSSTPASSSNQTTPAASNNIPSLAPISVPLPNVNENKKGGISNLAIIAIFIIAVFLCGFSLCFFWIKKWRHAEAKGFQEERTLPIIDEASILWRSEERSSEFPLFNFSQIADATNYFSSDNKLGQGGFGPVYKGVLPDGLEIAVKRLSAQSGQGLVEFKNEIQLIAKLQHRNLVRLIGWCIQGEEKILIYEYMPNKSLDFFIFDKMKGALINWEKRFEIIEGIAQGLLYLHKHSRLRIIHRDLKVSNILLDSEMVPKISDFGLARIFGPKELEANTNRVVGTYGYMAPEYASEGLFSIKSDVFSFGVLLLEIVSGKRNMGFHHGDFLNLLGYAWDRWKEGKWFELIDPSLTGTCQSQIERCIHVALLCVQENPADRSNMSDVIAFLSMESIILPEPKQPAYFNIRITEKSVRSSEFNGSSCSINDMTLTNQEGR